MEMNLSLSRQPQYIIDLQLQRSAEAINTVLNSLMRYFRRQQGTMNHSDELEQSAQLNKELSFIQEFNPLLYLVLMGEFREIDRILKGNKHFTQLFKVLRDLEREYRRQQQLYLFIDEENQRFLKYQDQRAHALRILARESFAHVIAHGDLLRYYEQELTHLRHMYHLKQTSLFETAYLGRVQRMEQALLIAHSAADISEESRHELENLRREYQEGKAKIDAMPTTHPDGKPDIEAYTRKNDALKRHEEKYGHLFDRWLQKNGHNAAIRAIHLEERQAVAETKKALAENEQEFRVQEERLKIQIESLLKNSEKTYEQRLQKVLEVALELNVTPLSEMQRKNYNQAYTQLEKAQELLRNGTSAEDLEKAVSSCTPALETLDRLIQEKKSEDLTLRWQQSMRDFNPTLSIQSAVGVHKVNDNAKEFNLLSTLSKPKHSLNTPPEVTFVKFKVNYRAQCHMHEPEKMLDNLKQSASDFHDALVHYDSETQKPELYEYFLKIYEQLQACDNRSQLTFALLESMVQISNALSKSEIELISKCEAINQWCTCLSPEPLAQEEDFHESTFRP